MIDGDTEVHTYNEWAVRYNQEAGKKLGRFTVETICSIREWGRGSHLQRIGSKEKQGEVIVARKVRVQI